MSELKVTFPKKPLLISLGIHGIVLISLIVKPFFSTHLEPYEQVIRVDVVAMPEKNQKIDEPKIKAAPEKKVEKSAKVEKKQEVIKKPQNVKKEVEIVKDEDSGLSEADALKKLQQLTEKTPEKKTEEAKPQEVKGNRVSKGSDLVGVEKLEYSNYRGVLHGFIAKNWDLPKWLLEGNLSAQAIIKIDKTGNIISKQLVKRSGNTIFDQHVITAIANASPVAPPPDKFKDIVYYEGVLLSFPR